MKNLGKADSSTRNGSLQDPAKFVPLNFQNFCQWKILACHSAHHTTYHYLTSSIRRVSFLSKGNSRIYSFRKRMVAPYSSLNSRSIALETHWHFYTSGSSLGHYHLCAIPHIPPFAACQTWGDVCKNISHSLHFEQYVRIYSSSLDSSSCVNRTEVYSILTCQSLVRVVFPTSLHVRTLQ